MAPKYPVFTQNSNKALNELRKLEGFGSELETLIGQGSAADGISAGDVANYLKQLGTKTSTHDTNITTITEDLQTRALKSSLNDTNKDLQNTKEKVPSSLSPVIFTPSWSGTPSYTVPSIDNGSYPLIGLDFNHVDSLVHPHADGISADWNSDFTNAVIDGGYVSNLSTKLFYTGSGTIAQESLVTTKEYTVADGFNFSCFVTLSDGTGDGTVLGYNGIVDASGISGYEGLSVSGTTEVEIVMVKDQDSAKVRVWVDGVEDNVTDFPPFVGGRLVVLANSNATFSEVKLTETTVDLGVRSILVEYKHVVVATIQASNPVTQKDVEMFSKTNIVLINEARLYNPAKDYKNIGYVSTVGAGEYYQLLTVDDVEEIGTIVKKLGNNIIGIDLILGGNGIDLATFQSGLNNVSTPKEKSVTKSVKLYSNDVAYLRERLTVTGDGAPTVAWSDLSAATQQFVIGVYKQGLPSGSPVPDDATITNLLTLGFAGYSLLQAVIEVAYGSRPLQSAPEFINMAPTSVVNQTNPSGAFTAQNIESYSQLSNKLADFNYTVDGAAITVTTSYSFDSAQSVKTALLTELGAQGPYGAAELIPEQLTTNSWLLNTLDVTLTNTIAQNRDSFPTYAEFQAVGLSALADFFVSLVGSQDNFNLLSYKTFAENVLLQTALTGKTITINDLNGDYTIDVTSLTSGDEQKFRQALAMKESADVESALNIPATGFFGYSVLGLLAPGDTVAVIWYYVSPTRNANNVWLYTRVFDLKTLSYVDADVRREGSLNIITDPNDIPQAVKDKYISAYSINLGEAGLINSSDKIVWNYTGEGGQVYYNYSDVSNPQAPINKIVVTNDGVNWLTEIEAYSYGWTLSGETPPDASKLNNVYVGTWAEVEARLVELATP